MKSMKHCNKCGADKPIEAFAMIKAKNCRRSYCRLCWNAYVREHNKANAAKRSVARARYHRENKVRLKADRVKWRTNNRGKYSRMMWGVKVHKYGLTRATYDRMVMDQSGRCAICDVDAPLVVDHDHVTGKVRGLLCDACNWGVGHFADDPERLIRAAQYVCAVAPGPTLRVVR